MSITRREFSIAAGSIFALTVLGCDGERGQSQANAEQSAGSDEPSSAQGQGSASESAEEQEQNTKANLAVEPFSIGSIEQYRQPGVYTGHKAAKGVWIVSDGAVLTVLSATCTHMGCTTHWKASEKRFECPCHHSHFAESGINTEGKARRPLERCALSLVEGEVQVDPTRRFRKDRDEWSDPVSALPLHAG